MISLFLNPASGPIPTQVSAWTSGGLRLPSVVTTNIETAKDMQTLAGTSPDPNANNATAYIVNAFKETGLDPIVGVPMFSRHPFDLANGLERAANGAYDSFYRAIASQLSGAGFYKIRLPWEADMPDQPWYCGGKEALFANGLRRMVNAFHAVSDKFVSNFCWGGSVYAKADLPAMYPGDEFVNGGVGQTLYNDENIGEAPSVRWAKKLQGSEGRGILWKRGFADARGRPFEIYELGSTGDDTFFVQQVVGLKVPVFWWNKTDGHSIVQQPKALSVLRAA